MPDFEETVSIALRRRVWRLAGFFCALLALPVALMACSGSSDETDTTAPSVKSVSISGINSSGSSATALVTGARLRASVTLTEAVTVSGTLNYVITIGSVRRAASYVSGSGSATLIFDYTLTSGDYAAANTITAEVNSLILASGKATDAAGNALVIAAPLPSVASNLSVNVTASVTALQISGLSLAGYDRTLSSGALVAKTALVLGDRLRVTLTLNKTVTVTSLPSIAIQIGSYQRQASYLSGSGSKVLTFEYLATSSDSASVGSIYVTTSALSLNGGAITDADSQTLTTLSPYSVNSTDVSASAITVNASFVLTSTAFSSTGSIPVRYRASSAVYSLTCTDTTYLNYTPPLAWTNAPLTTQSFAIEILDTSLTSSNALWFAWDIAASSSSLAEAANGVMSSPIVTGLSSYYTYYNSSLVYAGPCPEVGASHTYRIKLYALSLSTLGLAAGSTYSSFTSAIAGYQVGVAVMTGYVSR